MDYIIHDSETGLSWEVDDGIYAWDEACKRVYHLNEENALDHSDWRMPTSDELKSFMGIRRELGFVATIVWTSESYTLVSNSESAYWTFDVNNGDRKAYARSFKCFSFAVRRRWDAAVGKETTQANNDGSASFPTLEELRAWLNRR